MAATWLFPKPPITDFVEDKFAWFRWFQKVWRAIPKRVEDGSGTAQSAALAATTVYAIPAGKGGWYQVLVDVGVTQAATTSSIAGPVSVVYTDPVDSVAKTTQVGAFAQNNLNTTGSAASVTLTVYCAESTNLQLAIGYTSVGGTVMKYDYKYTVVYLGP